MWGYSTPNYVQKDQDIYWAENLNEFQSKKYEEFYQKLKEANLLYSGQDNEITLKQFLQARSYNIDKATAMYKNYIDWYKDETIQNYTSSYKYQEKAEVLKLYPQFYHNTDRFYRPVYIQILGQLDTKQLLQATTLDRYIKYHIKTWEQMKKYILPVCSEKAGRPIFSCCTILDLKGLGLTSFSTTTKNFLTRTSKIDSDNYPEQLGQMFVINAPYIFSFIWAFMKPLLDTRTQSKIVVLGSNYQEALYQVIPKENLPEFLGGTQPYDLNDIKDVGPWDTNYSSKEEAKSEDQLKAEEAYINNKSKEATNKYNDSANEQPVQNDQPAFNEAQIPKDTQDIPQTTNGKVSPSKDQ